MTREDRSHAAVDYGDLERALVAQDFPRLSKLMNKMPVHSVVLALERLSLKQRAMLYRLLPKEKALRVFEGLDVTLQSDLVRGLRNAEVAAVFAGMEPDDRVSLLDELPSSVATRLLHGLPREERELTAAFLGYPFGSIGRRMSPEYVAARQNLTATQVLDRVREHLPSADTVYTIPVLDDQRRLTGVVSLRDVMMAPQDTGVSELVEDPHFAHVSEDAESAARRCAELKLLALPIVDGESRLVGILTVDDALRILEEAESEDQARIGGSEPLRRPYLSTPVYLIVRSRVVWLLVLAVGAALTVQVLEVFEETLQQMVVLSLFIPLLIGTGGNAGNQAATTITQSLALEDVRPGDVFKVLVREIRVGLSLGLLLGGAGLLVTSLFYDTAIGAVIGLTLLSICTMAASVGGVMPLVARLLRADPAVFSNPFITTFVDAAGLVIYFFIAKLVLHI